MQMFRESHSPVLASYGFRKSFKASKFLYQFATITLQQSEIFQTKLSEMQ